MLVRTCCIAAFLIAAGVAVHAETGVRAIDGYRCEAAAQWIGRYYAELRGWRYYQQGPEYGVDAPGYAPYLGTRDATVCAANPNHNAGGEPFLEIGGVERGALLFFDVSDIAPSTEIREATLWLYLAARRGAPQQAEHTLSLFRVARPWTEGDGRSDDIRGVDGRRARTGEVTWRAAGQGLDRWAAPGCGAVPQDREEAPAASLTIAAADSERVWKSWDVTALVRSWVSAPEANHGVLLRDTAATEQASFFFQFVSSEALECPAGESGGSWLGYRPVLVVIPSGGS